jgi:transposase
MAERFVNVDRDTPMLLPVDLRRWVPENDLVHFVVNAVEAMNLSGFVVNRRGSGSDQFPPHMMLGLVIYCYANGVFGSRRIERATYRDVAVRYLTGDTHPDHDTICKFRRENRAAVREAFVEVLGLAKQMGLLKVGMVSLDGTHIKANASKYKSVRYDRAGELEEQLRHDIEELLQRAEDSDVGEAASEDGQQLPPEIARREALLEKMRWAREELQRRAREKEAPKKQGKPEGPQGGGESTEGEPPDSQQINLTDPDSALMRKSHHDSYQQAYNAQAVVDAEGSQLVLATDVISTPSDANQLEPALDKVVESVGPVRGILADAGYVNAQAIEKVAQKVELYVAIAAEDNNYRRYDFRPPKEKATKKVTDARLVAMREKLHSHEGKRIYGRRAATVEPVFGIIKAVMGFRQFLLRGLVKVRGEWELVCLAYNMKRLWSLKGECGA